MLKTLIATSTGLIVALPMTPALASGGHDDAEVKSAGQCSASSRWEFKVSDDDGRVELEFEVDSNVVGQQWAYTISGPAGVLSSGTRTTSAPSGSFDVELKTTGSVNDAFTAMATFGDETCDSTSGIVVGDDDGDHNGDDDSGDVGDDHGKGDDDSIEGSCTDDSAAVPTVKKSKATLKVTGARKGEKWRYRIRHDGKLVRKGQARTKGKKAVFKVHATSRGAGAFTASAAQVGSDDTCEVED